MFFSVLYIIQEKTLKNRVLLFILVITIDLTLAIQGEGPQK